MFTLGNARAVAMLYALAALMVSLMLAIGVLSAPDVSWRRYAGHLSLAALIPLPPLVLVWLGAKLAKSAAAERALAAGVLVSAALPLLMLVPVMLSREPLAVLALLIVPPAQVVVGVAALALVWVMGRRRA